LTPGSLSDIIEPVSFSNLLSIPRFLLAASCGSLGYFIMTLFQPILAFRLAEFNLSVMEIGLVFSIYPAFYVTTCLFINKIPRGIEKRGILIFSALMSYVTLSLCGPSELWGLPNSLILLCIG
jgi:hypothetical protein